MIYYICDRQKKVEHCLTHCFHGRPHQADSCTMDEVCNIEAGKKGIVVKCRPATKKELTQWGLIKEKD